MSVTAYSPDQLHRRAWDLDKNGETRGAIALFQQIVLDHPNTSEALDAQQYLASARELKPTVTSTTPAARVELVRVVDINIAFFPMVSLFVKAAFAVIPAAIIIAIIWNLTSGVMGGLFAGIR